MNYSITNTSIYFNITGTKSYWMLNTLDTRQEIITNGDLDIRFSIHNGTMLLSSPMQDNTLCVILKEGAWDNREMFHKTIMKPIRFRKYDLLADSCRTNCRPAHKIFLVGFMRTLLRKQWHNLDSRASSLQKAERSPGNEVHIGTDWKF